MERSRPQSAAVRRARLSDTFGKSLGLETRPNTARGGIGMGIVGSRMGASTARSSDFAPASAWSGAETADVRAARRRARKMGLLHFVPGVSGIRPGVDVEDEDGKADGGFAGQSGTVVQDEDVIWAMDKWREGRQKEIVRARNRATMATAVARHMHATRRREEDLSRRRRQQIAPVMARLRNSGARRAGTAPAGMSRD